MVADDPTESIKAKVLTDPGSTCVDIPPTCEPPWFQIPHADDYLFPGFCFASFGQTTAIDDQCLLNGGVTIYFEDTTILNGTAISEIMENGESYYDDNFNGKCSYNVDLKSKYQFSNVLL